MKDFLKCYLILKAILILTESYLCGTFFASQWSSGYKIVFMIFSVVILAVSLSYADEKQTGKGGEA